jgi:hypothetical protein
MIFDFMVLTLVSPRRARPTPKTQGGLLDHPFRAFKPCRTELHTFTRACLRRPIGRRQASTLIPSRSRTVRCALLTE